MTSNECIIEVHVRRTDEVVSIKVTPSVTTNGDIIKMICERINESEPDHYYLAMNYQTEMEDNMVFELVHENNQFQLVMKTKWIIECIAEQTMQRQRMKLEKGPIFDRDMCITEVPPVIVSETKQEPEKIDIPIQTTITSVDVTPTLGTSSAETSNEQNKVILSDVVRSTVRKIRSQDVQEYLHTALGKSFDILLMGSPRVGKSTLINAILKKNIAKTSPGRNACTATMAHYEYEEVYTVSTDDNSSVSSTCSIRIWDAPGIEDWTKLDVAQHIRNLVNEKNPICLIYCASPGSFADLEHIKVIIEQCKQLNVFIALVVTNMFASNEVDDILESFRNLLAHHSVETTAVGDVFYYGTIGLCTLVNSIEYQSQGQIMKPTGVYELMAGVMNSLSEEKLLQWCFALMDNGPFWIRMQSKFWQGYNYLKKRFF